MPRISKQRAKEEKRAQHILPLSDPGNRFHMRWMQCKQKRNHSGTAQITSHIQKQQKQQNSIGGMQTQVGDMVAGGIIAIDLPVDHMRNPCQRMPIACIEGRKRPCDALHVQPLLHMPVLQHIGVIVQGDEIIQPYTTK